MKRTVCSIKFWPKILQNCKDSINECNTILWNRNYVQATISNEVKIELEFLQLIYIKKELGRGFYDR